MSSTSSQSSRSILEPSNCCWETEKAQASIPDTREPPFRGRSWKALPAQTTLMRAFRWGFRDAAAAHWT